MLKIVIALVLLAHGIGHSMGLVQLFKVATVNPEWRGDSWLLTGTAGTTATQVVGGLLWTAAIVGFAALAAAVVGWLPTSTFAPLAIGSAAVSLMGLLFFPVAFPTFSTIGALAVDLAVVVATVWYHWLPTDLAA
ncbi:MAG TPA: hypothetical protein VF323_04345, partial [Candidatus Limnocylindrales bacterium]